ncbi:MAG: tRNA uridine-5-carboxymethylaminomethyl(34) synthesis GTPase MnmE [Pseudomonadota bacterium]
MDTIFAEATAPGRAGVSVIRVSGPRAFEAASMLVGALPEPRQASLRSVRDLSGSLIDQALILCFNAPHSFTGEDVVEMHLHGSIAVVRSVLRVLGELAGLRVAEPGEFTRRALDNSKISLTEVEGLSDLIEAETEVQRRVAMEAFSGQLKGSLEMWRSSLLRALALMEATIDFVDEEVPVDVVPEVLDLINDVKLALQAETESADVAERIRGGFEIAIVGEPNVGKSTLLNALAKRDVAITSEIAGTTRDVVEVRMDINGLPVTLLDTAGLRETDDVIEAIGVQRAVGRASQADLRVVLSRSCVPIGIELEVDDVVVAPMVDLEPAEFGVSGVTGEGVAELLSVIEEKLSSRTQKFSLMSRERHRLRSEAAVGYLENAVNVLLQQGDVAELATLEVRSAVVQLEEILGRVDVEDMLGEIFSNFCVGK